MDTAERAPGGDGRERTLNWKLASLPEQTQGKIETEKNGFPGVRTKTPALKITTGKRPGFNWIRLWSHFCHPRHHQDQESSSQSDNECGTPTEQN